MKMPNDQTIHEKLNEILNDQFTILPEKNAEFLSDLTNRVKWSIKHDQEALKKEIIEKRIEKNSKNSDAEQQEINGRNLEITRQERRKSHYTDVWISNELISAAHGLSLNEKRVIMLAATMLIPQDGILNIVPLLSINTSNMMRNYGITRQEASRALQEAGGIMKRKVIDKITNEKGVPQFGKTSLNNKCIKLNRFDNSGMGRIDEVNWTTQSIYHSKEGWLELEFNIELLPHLTNLHNNCMHYGLDKVNGIGSLYSWRLYELLYQFKTIGKRKFNIDEFNFILELPATYISNFAHTEKRVIIQAQNDLKATFPFTYNLIKSGKKVKEIQFIFTKQSNKY